MSQSRGMIQVHLQTFGDPRSPGREIPLRKGRHLCWPKLQFSVLETCRDSKSTNTYDLWHTFNRLIGSNRFKFQTDFNIFQFQIGAFLLKRRETQNKSQLPTRAFSDFTRIFKIRKQFLTLHCHYTECIAHITHQNTGTFHHLLCLVRKNGPIWPMSLVRWLKSPGVCLNWAHTLEHMQGWVKPPTNPTRPKGTTKTIYVYRILHQKENHNIQSYATLLYSIKKYMILTYIFYITGYKCMTNLSGFFLLPNPSPKDFGLQNIDEGIQLG